VKKAEGKRPVGRHSHRWEDNTEMDLKELNGRESLSLSTTALEPGVGLGFLQEFLPSFPV
jgi:hypothetical protein